MKKSGSGNRWLVPVLFSLSLIVPSYGFCDGWVSGFIGTVFGGSTGTKFSEAVENPSTTTFGANIGGMGAGVFGAEFDVGYTPKFFGEGRTVDNSGVLTMMGSLIIGIPAGGQSGFGLRPYGFAGLGLIRSHIEFREILDGISKNEFGYNLGAGIMGFFTDVVGIRAEYRYLRSFKSEDDDSLFPSFERGHFNFSRASIGILLRF